MDSTAPLDSSGLAFREESNRGWWAVGALAALVAITWLPALGLRLGDSHEGRILGRFALHVRNFWELGPLGSGLASNWEPMYSTPYAHHPPLTNALMVVCSALFGESEVALRIPGYLAGVLSLVALAALLRVVRMPWGPILISLGALSVTSFFWVFGRLGMGFVLIIFLAAAIMKLRSVDEPSRWLLGSATVVAFLTVMGSWEGMMAAALFGIWLWRFRGVDRVTVLIGLAMVGGVVVSLAWISYAAGLGTLTSQAADRVSRIDFSWFEWIVRQGGYAARLVPWWYLALAVPAIAAGFVDRRTRVVTAITLSVALVFGIGLAQNAWIHEYWNYTGLATVTLGGAALADAVVRRLAGTWKRILGAAVGVGLVLQFALLLMGPVPDQYFGSPADAGRLAAEHLPSPEQTVAWVGPEIATPRWLAYYWDLPARGLDDASLERANPGDLMLVRVDRPPEGMSSGVLDIAVAQIGGYALVTVADVLPEVTS